MPDWVEVRCTSPTCDRAYCGGRLLFKRRNELVVKAGRNGALIALYSGVLGAICQCGAEWANPDLKRVDALIGEEIAR